MIIDLGNRAIMNDFDIEFDENSKEDESDVKADANSFKELMLWGTDWTVETVLNQLKKGVVSPIY